MEMDNESPENVKMKFNNYRLLLAIEMNGQFVNSTTICEIQ
uniref:Uncharacterized protein n=1 Tax=Onchocerca volvulus TaxID=6282 RepID=A0A8R1Y4Z5_ONCVO